MAYEFQTTNIKGKEYVEVHERIKYFRGSKDFSGWSIEAHYEPFGDLAEVIVRAVIKDAEGRIRSTGMAHEVRGSSNINRTSHVENCETSAVGRALAMLGIGIESSIASADEVARAIEQQQAPPAPKELGEEAKAVVFAGRQVAERGTAALKEFWSDRDHGPSREAKKQLAGHPDWEAVKRIAEAADKGGAS